jgi:predicted ATPase/signal transduction histidine kinase
MSTKLEIHRGPRHVVVRVEDDGCSQVRKSVRPGSRAPNGAAQLQHEHAMLSELRYAPNLARPLALESGGDSPVLVLEDAGPHDLSAWLRRHGPLDIDTFFDFAISLSEIVAGLHGEGVIHRDINPSNVVVSANGKRLTLIDFGLATHVIGFAQATGQFAGTLPYIAPEQTGRMDLLVDHRADLYSLGATFYEMLTGASPFPSTDSSEFVHAHLARAPAPPSATNSEVPELLSAIVLKLLAKMPDQRYQSGEALSADLCEAQRRWRARGAIEPFELGLMDVARELVPPRRLYGREREVAELAAAYDRASAGACELVVIEGPAGMGKSVLAGTLRTPVEQHGRFVAGKFEPLRATVPYGAVAEAFRGFLRGLLAEPADVVESWRQRIKNALGANAGVVADLVPELARLIGSWPDVPTVGPVETENRFRLTLQTFVQALATSDSPLVLFLDDLQWADRASLALLEHLAGAPDTHHLLFITAHRSDEVGDDDPAARTLETIRSTGAKVRSLELLPLDAAAVTTLCAETLRCTPERVQPLAELVLRKTAGNPFFAERFLRHLHRSGVLVFDTMRGAWRWDLARAERASVTDNVVGLMISAIDRLPAESRELLKIAACLPGRIDLALLAKLAGEPVPETARRLWKILREGLLVPEPRERSLEPDVEATGEVEARNAAYRFVHDRVQQAAYSLLDDADRKRVHLAIGRQLLETLRDPEIDERLFHVVDQLFRGADLIENPSERVRLAGLALRAACRAKRSASLGTALSYLRMGICVLPVVTPEQAPHQLWFSLHREAAECAYFSGEREAADALFRSALEHASTPLEQAELFAVRVSSETMARAYQAAIEWGRRGLGLLGVVLPEDNVAGALPIELAAVRAKVRGRSTEELLDLAPMHDKRALEAMRLLGRLGPAAWASDAALWVLLTLRMVALTLEYGNAPASATGYVGYAASIAQAGSDQAAADAFGRLGIELARRYPDPAVEAWALAMIAVTWNHWRAPLRSSLPIVQRAVAAEIESGDFEMARQVVAVLVSVLFYSGAELSRVNAESLAGLALLRKIGQRSLRLSAYGVGMRCLQTRGHGRNRLAADEAEFEEEVRRGDATDQASYHVLRLVTSYVLRDFEQARERAQLAAPFFRQAAPLRSLLIVAELNFYSSLTHASACDRAAPSAKAELMRAIADNQQELGAWAERCPENFRHKCDLVAAELARIEGRPLEAVLGLYDLAIEGAHREGFLHEEAIANELACRCCLAFGRRRIASMYLEAARDGFLRWGAGAKVEALDEELSYLESGSTLPRAISRISSSDESTTAALDLQSLLKAAESLSSEVVLDRLLEKLMAVCLEVAGAERGALVLEEGGTRWVRAVGSVSEAVLPARIALEATDQVPRSLVAHVFQTGEPVVLADAAHQGDFTSDPYIAAREVKSALAVPIRHVKANGVLYLENNLATLAFPAERVRVLTLLSSQIAISLENGRLFEHLKTEVQERTRAIRVRDEFLSMASHELNTPMTALRLTVQRLARGSLSPETAIRSLKVIERQSDNLADLIGEMLDVSRMEQTEALEPQLEEVDLAAVVRDTLERLEAPIARAGCALALEVERQVKGRWDRRRLEQVVVNLLSNAIKFGAGKPIEVAVIAAGQRDTGSARLVVRDHGIGINADRIGRIFERFARGVPAESYGGLGLGLYIVRRIVSALGGSVRAESTPGAGSTFTVELPRAGPPARSRDGRAA